MKRNPMGRRAKLQPRKSPRALATFYYKEPLRRLRQLGIDPVPGVKLERIAKESDLTPTQRVALRNAYREYEPLFSRPHIVADFSLPESRIKDDYAKWQRKVRDELKRDGYTAKEITGALRGTFDEYRKRLIAVNDQRKLAAQEFGGHHRPNKKLRAAVIPVITGAPKKVRLKFDKHGAPFLQEGNVRTFDVKFDRAKLARGKRKYLEKVLASYDNLDRFMIVTGDFMTVGNSGDKKTVISKIMHMMGRYSDKVLRGENKEHYWKNWLVGIKVLRGDTVQDSEAARQGFGRMHRVMKAERKAEQDKLERLRKEEIKRQNRVRQQRKRAREFH